MKSLLEPQDDIRHAKASNLAPEPEEEEELLPEPALSFKVQPSRDRAMLRRMRLMRNLRTFDVVVAVHQEAIEDDKSINKKVKDFR